MRWNQVRQPGGDLLYSVQITRAEQSISLGQPGLIKQPVLGKKLVTVFRPGVGLPSAADVIIVLEPKTRLHVQVQMRKLVAKDGPVIWLPGCGGQVFEQDKIRAVQQGLRHARAEIDLQRRQPFGLAREDIRGSFEVGFQEEGFSGLGAQGLPVADAASPDRAGVGADASPDSLVGTRGRR